MSGTHFYYGHGKLLLAGEYFVLDGAEALACPTTVGQAMSVKYKKSYGPSLRWKSFDPSGRQWFDAEFEFWRFNIVKGEQDPNVVTLQSILKQARIQNPHFLRDEFDVEIETRLEFPLDWGLGSSSSLLYNIAQWAYVSPFELLSKTMGGSGYDVACAQSMGPIFYKIDNNGPSWKNATFEPKFKDQIFFIYLGRKQDTRQGVALYREHGKPSKEDLKSISRLSREMAIVDELSDFEEIVRDHEKIIGNHLGLEPLKSYRFNDYWGEMKSLGAWGGDFAMVTSDRSFSETKEYFNQRDIDVVISFEEMIRRHPIVENLEQ